MPVYCTWWERRALYNNTPTTHTGQEDRLGCKKDQIQTHKRLKRRTKYRQNRECNGTLLITSIQHFIQCLSHHFQHTHTHTLCLNSGVELAFCTVCAWSFVFILECLSHHFQHTHTLGVSTLVLNLLTVQCVHGALFLY